MNLGNKKSKLKPTIGVLGGGLGGLSIAARLANLGYKVTIIEKNSYFGGKANEIILKTERGDFRFDSGPSLVSVPEEFDSFYGEFGLDFRKELDLVKLQIVTRHFFDDCIIDSYADKHKFTTEIEQKTTDLSSNVIKFLDHSKKLYSTSKVYLKYDISFKTILKLDFWKAFVSYLTKPILISINKDVSRFLKDKKTIRIFNRLATFNGSNPYQAPMILNSLANVVHEQDTFYPKKGIITIPRSIEKICRLLGVTMINNAKIDKVRFENNKWKVYFPNSELDFDILINNIDYNIFLDLLDSKRKKDDSKKLSTSAILMYIAVAGNYDQLEIHNGIYFDDYKNEYNLINSGTLSKTPSIYLHVSSNVTPSDAPKGHQSWFVVINTPNINDDHQQNYDQLSKEVYNYFVKAMSKILKTNVHEAIIDKLILTPKDIQTRTSAYRGSIYGKNMNNLLRIISRPNNTDSKYKNLYHVGGTTHPGGGMPMVLASSRIVANLISQKYEK
jgi:phytoene desaturase